MGITLADRLLSVIPVEDAMWVREEFKNWLRTIDTGPDQGREEFRKMLIILVDEP